MVKTWKAPLSTARPAPSSPPRIPSRKRWSDSLAELRLDLVDDVVALVDLAQPAAVEGVLGVARRRLRQLRPLVDDRGDDEEADEDEDDDRAPEHQGHRPGPPDAAAHEPVDDRVEGEGEEEGDDEDGQGGREPAHELPQPDGEHRAGGPEEADVEGRVPVQRSPDGPVRRDGDATGTVTGGRRAVRRRGVGAEERLVDRTVRLGRRACGGRWGGGVRRLGASRRVVGPEGAGGDVVALLEGLELPSPELAPASHRRPQLRHVHVAPPAATLVGHGPATTAARGEPAAGLRGPLRRRGTG